MLRLNSHRVPLVVPPPALERTPREMLLSALVTLAGLLPGSTSLRPSVRPAAVTLSAAAPPPPDARRLLLFTGSAYVKEEAKAEARPMSNLSPEMAGQRVPSG